MRRSDARLAVGAGDGQVERRGRIGSEGPGDGPVVLMVVMMMVTVVQVETQRTEGDAAGRIDGAAALAARAEGEPIGEGGRRESRTENFLLVVAGPGRGHLLVDVVEAEHLLAVLAVLVTVVEMQMPKVASSHPQTRRRRRADDTLGCLLLARRIFAVGHGRRGVVVFRVAVVVVVISNNVVVIVAGTFAVCPRWRTSVDPGGRSTSD